MVPKGPGGTWKTGQRVPFDAEWIDQYGAICFIPAHHTFPPCLWRKGECAYRKPYDAAATA